MKTNILVNDCVEMLELEENEARSLLLYHAAPSNPVNEDILRQCLERGYFHKGDDDDDCLFLPLVSEMFGLQLGDDADQWMTKPEKLDTSNQPREEERSIFCVVRRSFDEHPIFSILRKSFDELSNEDQILFMDAALFYPGNYDDDEPGVWKISTLDWLHMVHGGSVEDMKRRLKSLKENLLRSFDEGSTENGVHDLWREFAAVEANVVKQKSPIWFYDNEDDETYRHREETSLRCDGWENLQRAFIWRRSKLKVELNFSLCSNLTVLTLRNVPLVNKQLDLSPLTCLKHLEVQLYGGPRPSVRVLGLGSLGRLVVLRWFRMLASSPCLEEIGLLTNLQVLQLHFLPWKKTDFSTLNFEQLDFSRLSLLRTFSLRAGGDVEWIVCCPPMFLRDVRYLRNHFEQWGNHCAEGGRYRVKSDFMLESLRNFQKLQSLQELDISRCGCIKALPGVDALVALLELKASGCTSLEEFPNLQKLQRLRRMDISYCFSIRALPGLDELVALLELDAFGCCKLAEFPNFQKLQKLQRLDISACTTIKAVSGLDELVALLELHAGGCGSLEELPSLHKLRSVQILDISECPLIKALPGLGDMVALRELRAKNCLNLAGLPGMRKLTSLRVLNLEISYYYEGYQLQHPEYFPESEYYEEAYSAFIRAASIKAVPGLDELIALSELTVDFGVFEDVPNLHKLTNLTKLNLRGWSAGAAPGVASLPNLQTLKISYCDGLQLVEPTGISSLTSLRRLKFDRCDFEDVSCLSSSPALQHLHVKYQQSNLKKLLQSVLELPSLRYTLYVEVGDNRDWGLIWDEYRRLFDRGLIVYC